MHQVLSVLAHGDVIKELLLELTNDLKCKINQSNNYPDFPLFQSHSETNFDIQDVEFTLKENGDVEWKFPDTQVGIAPNCTTLPKKIP